MTLSYALDNAVPHHFQENGEMPVRAFVANSSDHAPKRSGSRY